MDEAPMHEEKGNSCPKQEAFLGWQNVSSIFLGSSTFNIRRMNLEATSILLPFPRVGGWEGKLRHGFPIPLGTTVHHFMVHFKVGRMFK